MNKKYSISLFLFSTICCFFIICNSFHSDTAENKSADSEENLVSTDAVAEKNEGFYLFEKNGYVVVYLGDKVTVYEYTDILYKNLPEDMKEEIKQGMFLHDAEELFGFLENYSS